MFSQGIMYIEANCYVISTEKDGCSNSLQRKSMSYIRHLRERFFI